MSLCFQTHACMGRSGFPGDTCGEAVFGSRLIRQKAFTEQVEVIE